MDEVHYVIIPGTKNELHMTKRIRKRPSAMSRLRSSRASKPCWSRSASSFLVRAGRSRPSSPALGHGTAHGAVRIHALEQPDGLRFALVRGTSILRAGELFDEGLSASADIALLIPIGDATHPVGLLGLGKPPGADSIRRRGIHTRARQRGGERHCQRACAYGNDRLNRLLDRKIEDLKTLLDLGRALVISPSIPMKWREFSDSRWLDIGR